MLIVYAARTRSGRARPRRPPRSRAFDRADLPWDELAFWSTRDALRGLPRRSLELAPAPRAEAVPASRAAPLGGRATMGMASDAPRPPVARRGARADDRRGDRGHARRRLSRASSPSARTASCRSAGSGCPSPPGTRARSTSTCRSWTGARASSRSGCRPACASTSARSTAPRCSKVADGGALDVGDVRAEARDAIAAYLRTLIGVVALLRPRARPAHRLRRPQPRRAAKLRYTMLAGGAHDARHRRRARRAAAAARRRSHAPQYYAYGADIPRALDAVAAVRRSGERARPGARRAARRPRPARHGAGRPHAGRGPPADHDRLRPAQQRHLAPDPGARGRRRAGVLPRRPQRPRHAARDRARRAASRRSAGRSCSSPATTTPTARRRSWPTTARSC